MSSRHKNRSRNQTFDRGSERSEDERRFRDQRGYDDRGSGFRDRDWSSQGRDHDSRSREARFDRDFEREPGWRARPEEWDHEREDREQWSSSDRRYPDDSERRAWRAPPEMFRGASYGGQYDDEYQEGQYGAGDWSGAQYGRSSHNQFGGQYRDRPYRGMQSDQWDDGRISTDSGRLDTDWGSYGRGRFQGKGPKGYKRSDERIREDVCDMLCRGHIDASDVEVEVSDGEVTLKGTVPERGMKYVAERLIDRLSGVKDVTNQIRVKRETGTQDQNSRGTNGPNDANRSRSPTAPRS
jgi:osmotically-inducible protein OsmY